MKSIFSKTNCLLILSSLAFLPSCTDWFKGKLGGTKSNDSSAVSVNDNSEVVATWMGGKPLVTVDELQKQLKTLIENHPYGAMLMQMEGLERKFLEGLVSQKAMTRYIEEQGINKTKEYLQQLESLIQMLNTRFFQMKHQPKVTDAELREFFEQNKQTMQEAIVSRGGVTAMGASFATQADAKAFLEKVKGKGANFEKIAKEANVGDKFRDFKMVNATSPIEPLVREKIVAIKKFPSYEVVKVNDTTYYVVYASGKEEQKFRTFDEMKQAVEQRVNAKKQEEALEKAVEKLKKDYDIQIREEYFNKKAESKPGQPGAPQDELVNDEQLEMLMPEGPGAQEETRKVESSAKAA